MSHDALAAALARYRDRHPDETGTAATFAAFLASAGTVFARTHAIGHFTGSAWVVSADGRRVLLTHHRKLDRWLQPGGHADGDADLARVALREAEEETGVPGLRLEDPEIFDLDRHLIPARKSDPDHWHYDVRYVVRCGDEERFVVSEESHALAWREVAELVHDPAVDASVRRMAAKWLARANPPR
jgi:8-oxo-dGTP pyrophosphatase MutT (NUDIX family)